MPHDHDMNVRSMVWRPALVRLTQIPHPEIDGGTAMPCFIDPTAVILIARSRAQQWKHYAVGEQRVAGDTREAVNVVDGTCIQLSGGAGVIFVQETPEEVATAINRAIGHEPEKPKAVP